ncbi:uncharacterized protein [Diadema setosum]|uniref:uncharacterized protein n=1 Tax=Diadema setosum TaxID=31175 RepID=UPI003B3A4541
MAHVFTVVESAITCLIAMTVLMNPQNNVVSKSCNLNTELTCDDGSCKSIFYARCNGRRDCPGMADEMNCSTYHGTATEFIELGLYQSVNITSPDWPKPYAAESWMAWKFQGPPESAFRLDFLHFDLSRFASVILHYNGNLSDFRNNELLSRLPPGEIVLRSHGNELAVQFVGGRYGGSSGFFLAVTALPFGVSFEIDPQNPVNITSPWAAPQKVYSGIEYAEYHIAAGSGQVIVAFVDDFDIEQFAVIAITDGSNAEDRQRILALFYFNDHPQKIYSKTNEVTVTYHYHEGTSSRHRGFRIELHAIEQ